VQTGQVHGLVRRRHRSAEFIELLRLLDGRVPKGQGIHLILDPVRLHCSAEVAVYVAYRPWRFRFRWLPVHASWLSFIEVWFAVLSKKCLKRGELADFAAAERHITDFIATYNARHAHPYSWRKGMRFYQRLKAKLAASQALDAVLPLAA
jgi:DDE superfamily endonuclease